MALVLLALATIVAIALIVGTTILRPVWGLVLGTAFVYNPAFNYRFLFTHQFQGGSERALVSLAVVACLYAGVFVARRRNNLPLLPAFRLPWQMAYFVLALIGAAVGMIAGHQIRLVAADLFPVVEFALWLPVAALIVGSTQGAGRLAVAILAWSGIVAAIEVALYLADATHFASKFALSGGTTLVPRLDDFIPALFLPLSLALAIHVHEQPWRVIAIASSIALTGATALSFFRSLWVGLFVALVVMAVAYWRLNKQIALTRSLLIRIAAAGGLAAIVVAILSLVRIGSGGSITELVVSRVAHIEPTSGTARVIDNLQLLGLIKDHPFGVGLGGMEGNLPLFSTSNYYLSAGVELGVIAVVLWVVMAASFLKQSLERYDDSTDSLTRAIVVGTLGSYTCMAVTLLTFPSLLHYPIPAFLGLLGGIVSVMSRTPRATSSEVTESTLEARLDQRDVSIHLTT